MYFHVLNTVPVAYRMLMQICHDRATAAGNSHDARVSSTEDDERSPTTSPSGIQTSASTDDDRSHTFTDESVKKRVVKSSVAALVPLIAAALIML